MKQLICTFMLGLLAMATCAAPLAYEPFNYNAGELLAPRTLPAGHFWIAQASGANDAAIVATNLTIPGLAPSTGSSFTNGGAGQGNRFVLNTQLTNGTVYVSYAISVDSLGASYLGTNQANPTFITSICFSNVLGTLIQYCCLLVNTNGADQSSYLLGIRQASGQAFDTYLSTLYPVGQTLFIVQGYTFVDDPGKDVCDVWINPDPATFGSNAPPAPTLTAFQPPGLTDAFWIDRINFRQAAAASIPAAMTFDELRVGTNWADVTPPIAPQLSIAPSGTTAVLSWPTNFTDFSLISSDDITLARTTWSSVANAVSVNGTNYNVTVDLLAPRLFYSLVLTNPP